MLLVAEEHKRLCGMKGNMPRTDTAGNLRLRRIERPDATSLFVKRILEHRVVFADVRNVDKPVVRTRQDGMGFLTAFEHRSDMLVRQSVPVQPINVSVAFKVRDAQQESARMLNVVNMC